MKDECEFSYIITFNFRYEQQLKKIHMLNEQKIVSSFYYASEKATIAMMVLDGKPLL